MGRGANYGTSLICPALCCDHGDPADSAGLQLTGVRIQGLRSSDFDIRILCTTGMA